MHKPASIDSRRRPHVRRTQRRRCPASVAVLLVGTLLLTLGSYGALQWPLGTSNRSAAATAADAAADAAGGRPVSFGPGAGHGASHGRVVRTTLTADEQEFQIGDKRVIGKGYNGGYVGPTLYLRPGDTLDLTLVNHLAEGTNLHFHGMHVSPTGLSDNVFRSIGAGQTARYVVKLPLDVDPGLYWYHSHQHSHVVETGLSEEQVFGGMSGLIVVEGLPGLLPAHLRNVPDKLFALKDFQDHGGVIPTRLIDSNAPTNRTVNGQFNPRIDIKPGETQLWRFANIGADIFYDLALEGHKFYVVAQDANPVWKVWETDHLFMPPGSRFEVLVQGAKAGSYTLKTRAINTGPGGDQYPETKLATVVSSGAAQRPATLPTGLVPKTKRWGWLGDQPIARKRTTTFMERPNQPNRKTYYIDDKQFDVNRVDAAPTLGTTEQWTVRNTSTELHPFHIHQDDFQIVSINGKPYNANGQQDTVALPYGGGEVVVRDSFEQFTGNMVYHCHILNHEDLGMMLIVDIVAPGQRPTPPGSIPQPSGAATHDENGKVLITGEAHEPR